MQYRRKNKYHFRTFWKRIKYIILVHYLCISVLSRTYQNETQISFFIITSQRKSAILYH